MRFFIVNHCSHNKGDNSVLYYLMECIKAVAPDCKISVSSSDGSRPFWCEDKIEITYWPGGKLFRSPRDGYLGRAYKKANSLFMRHFLYKIFIYLYSKRYDNAAKIMSSLLSQDFVSQIRSCDKVICTGGHHISNVLEKNCINSQLVSLAIADIFNKKTTLWSQSIGPFTGAAEYTKKAISRILENCDNIYVRDDLSIECVKSISGKKAIIAPDSVFLAGHKNLIDSTIRKSIICAVYTAGIKDEGYLVRYSNAWKNVAEALASQGYEIIFIPMQYKNCSGDERAFLENIIRKANNKLIKYIDEDSSPKETIGLFKAASAIIGHKTHSVIYGLALAKPTVAVAYHEKTRQFMSDFGLQNYVFAEVINQEEHIVSSVLASIEKGVDKELSRKSSELAEKLLQNMKSVVTISAH